jgi:hypothetical protein
VIFWRDEHPKNAILPMEMQFCGNLTSVKLVQLLQDSSGITVSAEGNEIEVRPTHIAAKLTPSSVTVSGNDRAVKSGQRKKAFSPTVFRALQLKVTWLRLPHLWKHSTPMYERLGGRTIESTLDIPQNE